MEPQTSNKALSVQKLLGLNERSKFGVGELGEFDELVGFYTPNEGMLTQVPGKLFLQQLDGSPVYRTFQTNDSRKNIIIQTGLNVYVMSEDDFYNRPVSTNLTPVPTTEEEDMSQALIAHVVASGGTGGGGTTAATFVTGPLTDIISQINPDGSAASFASLAGNIVTLQTGWYRIRGWTLCSDGSAATTMVARLFNTGTSAPLWTGLKNENVGEIIAVAGKNLKLEVGGIIHATAPLSFRFEVKSSATQTNSGLGHAEAVAGANDIYRWLEILRTGN